MKHTTGKNELSAINQLIALFPDINHAVEHVNLFFSNFFHDDPCILPSAPTCNNELICDPFTVHDLLLKLKTNKAMGSDQIRPLLLKLSADFICYPLSFIYNLSHNTACVPELWKKADVVPIPKSSPVKKDQLRPISLLPVVSKIYEKIVLEKYCKTMFDSLDDCQFAYRKKSSTVCALVTIHETVLKFLDNSEIGAVRIITFDMSHAFDCV
ncbi:MAG: hypothetical protein AAGK05_19085, partial [Pseudomonadota bacterium]